jgi:hypothetical protein
MRWLSFGLAASLVVTALGCALRDYEAHIDAQRDRLKVFDDENRLLSEAIEVPTFKAKSKEGLDVDLPYWPFDVYLRLPKDISGKLRDKAQFNYQDLPLFRYSAARDGYNVFVAAGLIADKKEPDKDGKPRTAVWTPDTFREYVRGALMDFYRKEYRVNPEFPVLDRSKFKKFQLYPIDDHGKPLSVPVTFEGIGFKDDFNRNLKEFSLFQVYFHQAENRQVAIIFQSPLAWMTDQNLIDAVDRSLKTLETGGYATLQRQALLKRKKR